jgi:hypothetical protein
MAGSVFRAWGMGLRGGFYNEFLCKTVFDYNVFVDRKKGKVKNSLPWSCVIQFFSLHLWCVSHYDTQGRFP